MVTLMTASTVVIRDNVISVTTSSDFTQMTLQQTTVVTGWSGGRRRVV